VWYRSTSATSVGKGRLREWRSRRYWLFASCWKAAPALQQGNNQADDRLVYYREQQQGGGETHWSGHIGNRNDGIALACSNSTPSARHCDVAGALLVAAFPPGVFPLSGRHKSHFHPPPRPRFFLQQLSMIRMVIALICQRPRVTLHACE